MKVFKSHIVHHTGLIILKPHISNSTPITKTDLIITPIIENNFVNIFTEKINELI